MVLTVLLVLLTWRVLVHWGGPWALFWPGGWFGMPWLWIALLAFVWLRWGRRHAARRAGGRRAPAGTCPGGGTFRPAPLPVPAP